MNEEHTMELEAALYLEENAKMWAEKGASPLSWLSYVLQMRGNAVTPLTLAAELHFKRLPLIAACCWASRVEQGSA